MAALPDWTYQSYTAQLQPGDILLLTTDGITEAENARVEEFGDERLLQAARDRDSTRHYAAGHSLLRRELSR